MKSRADHAYDLNLFDRLGLVRARENDGMECETMLVAERKGPAAILLSATFRRTAGWNRTQALGLLENSDAAANQLRQLATELCFQRRPPLEEALHLIIWKRNLQTKLFPVSNYVTLYCPMASEKLVIDGLIDGALKGECA